MGIFFICAILSVVLFQNFTVSLGLISRVLPEGLVTLLFIYALLRSRLASLPHLWYCVLLFLVAGLCSVALNGSGILNFAFSLRLLFRYYLLYLGIVMLALDDSSIKRINIFLWILLLLELPVVAVNFARYGIAEKTMGAYTQAGGVTTMLPISFIFYMAAYYFLFQRGLRYILSGIGFILFSIVGAKRAIAFLYPIQFLAIYYYIYVRGTGARLTKKISRGVLVFALIAIVSGSIFYFNHTLNPESEVGGDIDVGYAFDYAVRYESAESASGYSTGRLSTTLRVLSFLWERGISKIFFGFGPGSIMASRFDLDGLSFYGKLASEVGIGYGLTAMTRMLLEYGFFGLITHSLIFFILAHMCWRYYLRESDPYWKAFAAGSVGFSFAVIFFYFGYSREVSVGDTMPSLYFYAMGVVYTRMKRMSGFSLQY